MNLSYISSACIRGMYADQLGGTGRSLVFRPVIAALASIVLSSTAAANVLNVDIGTGGMGSTAVYSGTGPAPDAGTVWNQATPNASNLQDSTGSPTTVNVTFTNYTNVFSDAWPGALHDLLYDYVYKSSPAASPMSLTISNLADHGYYDLYFLPVGGIAYGTYGAAVTVNGVTLEGTANPLGSNTWINGVNYVLFSGVQADGSGNITATFVGNSSHTDEANLAGLQIVTAAAPVPEPASLALFGVGGVGLFAVRRRRG